MQNALFSTRLPGLEEEVAAFQGRTSGWDTTRFVFFPRSGCLDLSETPSRRFTSPFLKLRPVSVVETVVFGRLGLAERHM